MCSRMATSCVNCGRPLNWSAGGPGGFSPFLAGVLFVVGLVAFGVVLVWLLGYVRL
jgi:hypothetical protein